MTEETPRGITNAAKGVLRKLIPDYVLRHRNIVARLGPQAGRIYKNLLVFDMLGVHGANQQLVPRTARSFVFVCFGNIMRSAMAEHLMQQALTDAGVKEPVRVASAGIHAVNGREAHPWAVEAGGNLSISLAEHRATLLTREMVEGADCILAMDFQNKAELLNLYPAFQEKIYMLGAYAEGRQRGREIPDPYFGDLESTRACGEQLRTCIRNLVKSVFL